jgi:hypothetical protein
MDILPIFGFHFQSHSRPVNSRRGMSAHLRTFNHVEQIKTRHLSTSIKPPMSSKTTQVITKFHALSDSIRRPIPEICRNHSNLQKSAISRNKIICNLSAWTRNDIRSYSRKSLDKTLATHSLLRVLVTGKSARGSGRTTDDPEA